MPGCSGRMPIERSCSLPHQFPPENAHWFRINYRVFRIRCLCQNGGRGNLRSTGADTGPDSLPRWQGYILRSYDGAAFTPARYSIVCPDSSRLPSRSISTIAEGVPWKNRQVPCRDRIQSSITTAASRAMTRSRARSFCNSPQAPGSMREFSARTCCSQTRSGSSKRSKGLKTCGLLLFWVYANPSDS